MDRLFLLLVKREVRKPRRGTADQKREHGRQDEADGLSGAGQLEGGILLATKLTEGCKVESSDAQPWPPH